MIFSTDFHGALNDSAWLQKIWSFTYIFNEPFLLMSYRRDVVSHPKNEWIYEYRISLHTDSLYEYVMGFQISIVIQQGIYVCVISYPNSIWRCSLLYFRLNNGEIGSTMCMNHSIVGIYQAYEYVGISLIISHFDRKVYLFWVTFISSENEISISAFPFVLYWCMA